MIRVLVVDDSALVRKILSQELGRYPDIEVVGVAVDPYVARDKILKLKPDVITLDLEMPRMDGLTFLARLMRYFPIPVVVVSSVASENSQNGLRALSLGAIAVIEKPGTALSTPDIARDLVRAIRSAHGASVATPPPVVEPVKAAGGPLATTHKVIALGASTGGTRAIEHLVQVLPAEMPGLAVVQHMPAQFTASFAQRLDTLGRLRVKEAADRDQVVPGRMLIAPGGYHMALERNGAYYHVRVIGGEPRHHQKPAVDVLFESAADSAGANAVGVLLTGMGADGAKGLLNMKDRGAWTLAQDEASSVVWGMPGEAVKLGAAREVVPLGDMAQAMLRAVDRKGQH